MLEVDQNRLEGDADLVDVLNSPSEESSSGVMLSDDAFRVGVACTTSPFRTSKPSALPNSNTLFMADSPRGRNKATDMIYYCVEI